MFPFQKNKINIEKKKNKKNQKKIKKKYCFGLIFLFL